MRDSIETVHLRNDSVAFIRNMAQWQPFPNSAQTRISLFSFGRLSLLRSVGRSECGRQVCGERVKCDKGERATAVILFLFFSQKFVDGNIKIWKQMMVWALNAVTIEWGMRLTQKKETSTDGATRHVQVRWTNKQSKWADPRLCAFISMETLKQSNNKWGQWWCGNPEIGKSDIHRIEWKILSFPLNMLFTGELKRTHSYAPYCRLM